MLGVDLPLNAPFSLSSTEPLSVGGISCRWLLGEQGDLSGGELGATIVPAGIGLSSELASSVSGSPRCDTGADLATSNSGCRVGVVVGGWWIEAEVFLYSSAAAQRDAADTAQARLEAAVAGVTPPTIVPRTALDCAVVDTAVAPGSNLGLGAFTVSPSPALDPPTDLAEFAAARAAGVTDCTWIGASGLSFSVSLLSQATTDYDACAARSDATRADVAGLAKVVTFPIVDEGAELLCASDGISSAHMWGPPNSGGATEPWTAAQLAQVSKILAPALAVASR